MLTASRPHKNPLHVSVDSYYPRTACILTLWHSIKSNPLTKSLFQQPTQMEMLHFDWKSSPRLRKPWWTSTSLPYLSSDQGKDAANHRCHQGRHERADVATLRLRARSGLRYDGRSHGGNHHEWDNSNPLHSGESHCELWNFDYGPVAWQQRILKARKAKKNKETEARQTRVQTAGRCQNAIGHGNGYISSRSSSTDWISRLLHPLL